MNPNKVQTLSIQVGLYGLSYLIISEQNETFRRIPYWAETPSALNEALEKIYRDEWKFLAPDSVILLHDNELNTLVPGALFDDKSSEKYLENTIKLLPGDTIQYDKSLPAGIVNLYVPYENVNNFFIDQFGGIEFYHSVSSLVQLTYQKHHLDKTEIFIRPTTGRFQMIVWHKGSLRFFNSFPFETIDDFLYYFFFVWEKQELTPLNPAIYILSSDKTAEIKDNLNDFLHEVYLPDWGEKQMLKFKL